MRSEAGPGHAVYNVDNRHRVAKVLRSEIDSLKAELSQNQMLLKRDPLYKSIDTKAVEKELVGCCGEAAG